MHAGHAPRPGILRSRFLWRLFGGYAAVLLVTGLFATWQAQRRLEASLLATLRASLEDQCLVFEPYAARVLREGDPGLAAELVRLREAAGVRVTLIGADGRVLGDS